jgi:hypothetical protein
MKYLLSSYSGAIFFSILPNSSATLAQHSLMLYGVLSAPFSLFKINAR